ncbi:DNA-binding protein HU [Bacillus thuringiensis serovar israelensis ATCC 35646]|nr:DNA-binding protein HU [Bacillus thuringiensis serovar israelensis ATCC 35646]
MKNMNKTELIKNVAQNAEISQKEATVVVQTVVESITNTLAAGEKVQLIGFGTFEVRERAARTAVTHKLVKKCKSQH